MYIVVGKYRGTNLKNICTAWRVQYTCNSEERKYNYCTFVVGSLTSLISCCRELYNKIPELRLSACIDFAYEYRRLPRQDCTMVHAVLWYKTTPVAITFLVPLPSTAASDRSKFHRPKFHKWVPGLYSLENLHICICFISFIIRRAKYHVRGEAPNLGPRAVAHVVGRL